MSVPSHVDVECWRVRPQRHGTRDVVDVRYCVWRVDGSWHASAYGISIERVHLPGLLADLQAVAAEDR
jgi:hypothetical protein